MKKEIISITAVSILALLLGIFIGAKKCSREVIQTVTKTEIVEQVAIVDKAFNVDSINNIHLRERVQELENHVEYLEAVEISQSNKIGNFKVKVAEKTKVVITAPCPSVEEKQDLFADIDTLKNAYESKIDNCEQQNSNLTNIVKLKTKQITSKDSMASRARAAFNEMVKKDILLVASEEKNKTTIKKQKNKIIKKSIENWTWRSIATFVGYLILKNNIK